MITTCTKCGGAYGAGSEEQANESVRLCYSCRFGPVAGRPEPSIYHNAHDARIRAEALEDAAQIADEQALARASGQGAYEAGWRQASLTIARVIRFRKRNGT